MDYQSEIDADSTQESSSVEYEQTTSGRTVARKKKFSMIDIILKLPFIENERQAKKMLFGIAILFFVAALWNVIPSINLERNKPVELKDIPPEIRLLLDEKQLEELMNATNSN